MALGHLAGLARLRVVQGEPQRALELLGLILDHPRSDPETLRLDDEPLLAKLRVNLPPDEVEAGLERGRNLDEVVEALLEEMKPE